MNQNILTLCELLQDMGHEAFIAVADDKAKQESENRPKSQELTIVSLQEMCRKKMKFDILLQSGVTYGNSIIKELRDACGAFKNVHIHYGPRLFSDIELAMRPGQTKLGMFSRYTEYVDDVWISPHYDYSIDYFKILYKREEVKILPYIWSPCMIQKQEEVLNQKGKTCFYQKSDRVNIAIIEPNNVVKNSICPAMIAEGLHNKDEKIISSVDVYSTDGIRGQKYYEHLMLNLDLVQEHKMNFFSRFPFTNIFSERNCNYVLSHQHKNALNYTYLEALYFGIPLIHNSDFIKDEAGYYYPEFELKKGVKALEKAINTHNDRIEDYKEEGKKIIWKYSAKNPKVQDGYREIL